jgi:chromosome segregation ATPase
MKETRCAPRRFVSLSKKHGSFAKSLSRISSEIHEKSQTLDALKREIETAETRIRELQSSIRYYQEAATQANATKFQLEAEANSRNTALLNLDADIAEKERVRLALIIQNAKLLGIPESETEQYQLQKKLELLEEISKIRLRQLLEKSPF